MLFATINSLKRRDMSDAKQQSVFRLFTRGEGVCALDASQHTGTTRPSLLTIRCPTLEINIVVAALRDVRRAVCGTTCVQCQDSYVIWDVGACVAEGTGQGARRPGAGIHIHGLHTALPSGENLKAARNKSHRWTLAGLGVSAARHLPALHQRCSNEAGRRRD